MIESYWLYKKTYTYTGKDLCQQGYEHQVRACEILDCWVLYIKFACLRYSMTAMASWLAGALERTLALPVKNSILQRSHVPGFSPLLLFLARGPVATDWQVWEKELNILSHHPPVPFLWTRPWPVLQNHEAFILLLARKTYLMRSRMVSSNCQFDRLWKHLGGGSLTHLPVRDCLD